MSSSPQNRISIAPVTLPLLDEYYRGFQTDPVLFMDESRFFEYEYSSEKVSAYYKKLASDPDRRDFMIMLGARPIGEIALKHIDRKKRECELSIHLQNDSVKNRGFGSEAERLALEFAFNELGMKAVNAGCVLKNGRSMHVLEKLGFRKTGQDETFAYYRLEGGGN